MLVTSLALSSLPFGVTAVPSVGSSSSGASSGTSNQPAPAPPPRLILTTKGIVTPELKASFTEMLREATPAGVEQPLIAVVITAMLAPGQKPKNQQQAMAAKAAADALRAAAAADASAGGAATPLLPSGDAESRPKAATAATISQAEAERAALSAAAAVAAEEVVAEAGLPARVRVIDVSRDSHEQMEAVLAEASCTFVLGGNTFYLMHWMRESGFDTLVRRRVAEGMLYVGSSAGAIVAGQSISTAYWKGWDDPKAATDLGADFQDPRALALVPGHSFFPHHLPEWEETVEQHKPSLGHSLITLREDCGCGCYVSGRGRGRERERAADAAAHASSPPQLSSPPPPDQHERQSAVEAQSDAPAEAFDGAASSSSSSSIDVHSADTTGHAADAPLQGASA